MAERTPEIYADINFVSILPGLYAALRFHDLSQVLTGKKTGHAELSAVYFLAWALSLDETVRKRFNLSDEIIYKTVLAIYHHNKIDAINFYQYESFKKPQEPDKDLVISAKEIINKTKAEIGDIYEFMPEIARYQDLIESFADGSRDFSEPLHINREEERESLRKMCLLVALADKLDSIGEHSIVRTLSTPKSAGRAVFKPVTPPEGNTYKDPNGTVFNLSGIDEIDREIILRVSEIDQVKDMDDLGIILAEIFRRNYGDYAAGFSKNGLVDPAIKKMIRDMLMIKISDLESLLIDLGSRERERSVKKWLYDQYFKRMDDLEEGIDSPETVKKLENRLYQECEALWEVLKDKIEISEVPGKEWREKLIY